MKLYKIPKFKVEGITLLTQAEALEILRMEKIGMLTPCRLRTLNSNNYYWLRTPGTFSDSFVMTVDGMTGAIVEAGCPVISLYDVRPVLIATNLISKHQIGDFIRIADLDWVVISHNKLFCTTAIGSMYFSKANISDFDRSDIKQNLEAWAKVHEIINSNLQVSDSLER